MRLDSAGTLCYIVCVGTVMTLSETMRDAMKRDGRSLYALAADSGVSRGQVVRFYNGQRELTLPAADRLCKALGLRLQPVRRKRKGG